MFEPSLTVGLVPRIASRVVATDNYPTTQKQNDSLPGPAPKTLVDKTGLSLV
jgi:hypothetical protein